MLRLPLPEIPSKDELETVKEFGKEYPFTDINIIPHAIISLQVEQDKYIWVSKPKYMESVIIRRNEKGIWDYDLGNDIRFIESDARSKQIEDIKGALRFGMIEPKRVFKFLLVCTKGILPPEIISYIMTFIRTIYLNHLGIQLKIMENKGKNN